MKKTRDDVVLFVQAVAHYRGWRINPDREFLDALIDGLLSNYNQHNYFLCPCRDSWEDKDKDKDVICPCYYAGEDIKEYGHCYCGLYLSEKFLKSGKEVEGIEERRPYDLIP